MSEQFEMVVLERDDVVSPSNGKLHFFEVGEHLDEHTFAEVMASCRDLIEKEQFGQGHQIVIDSSETSLDSMGIATLLHIEQYVCQLKNGNLGIIPSNSIRRTFRVTGLDRHFTIIYEDREHAHRANIQ